MKKLQRWLKDYFSPEEIHNLDISVISGAFNDVHVRSLWLAWCFDELKRINLDVDKRLLSGSESGLIDLCARRRAFQDVLEAVLSAKRQVTQGPRPNPPAISVINLDRVTV